MVSIRTSTASITAALLALLILSFATVQSIVMRASMPSAGVMMPICGDPGDPAAAMSVALVVMKAEQASAAAAHDHHSRFPAHHQTACPYCAAAGHAPIIGSVAPIQHSTTCVFTAFRTAASLGPRGPPAAQPRARGPPSDPLTA